MSILRQITLGAVCCISWSCVGTRCLICAPPPGTESPTQGDPVAYVDTRGDTVIPRGEVLYCGANTIRTWGFVILRDEQRKGPHDRCIAIDRRGHKLFNAYWFDNGPDLPQEGLFRIRDDRGRIGYADTAGRVVITPRFEAAFPFEHGRARVALQAEELPDGEHTRWEANNWLTIDRRGRVVVQ